jgi:class 3 adenylate cyclase/tetratricopeptide (TPR) repeat protein
VDSLKQLVATAREDTAKVNLLNRIAAESRAVQQRTFAEDALRLAHRLGYPYGIAEASSALARAWFDLRDFDKSLAFAQTSDSLCEQFAFTNARLRGSNAFTIGRVSMNQGNFTVASEQLFKALELFEQSGFLRGQLGALDNIGQLLLNSEEPTKAIEYLQRALVVAKRLNAMTYYAGLLSTIGSAYQYNIGTSPAELTKSEQQRLDSALAYYSMALPILRQFKDTSEIAYTMGNIGKLYQKQKLYDSALIALRQSIHLNTLIGKHQETIPVIRALSDVLCAQGNGAEALRTAKQANALAIKYGLRPLQSDALKGIAQSYKVLGQYKEALLAYEQHISLRDSILSADMKRELTAREDKYEAHKKQVEIDLLNKDKQRETLLRNAMIVGCGVVLIAALWLGRLYRIKRRDNRRLAAISRIGADLAGSLVFREVVLKIHEEVQHIMDTPIFNIGIYKPLEQRIEFRYLIENGEFLPPPLVPMTDTARPAVRCVLERKEIVINNEDIPILVGAKVQSLVYVPLISNNEVLGVFSVQSLQKNSYSAGKVAFLKVISSHIATALQNVRAFEEIERQREALAVEQQKSEHLLLNVLPPVIAERMKQSPARIADYFESVSVMFVDFVGFTTFSQNVNAEDLVEMLDAMFSDLDAITRKYGLEKIKTIGDAYMVASGIPTPRHDHVEALARAALEIQATMKQRVRIGIHTGAVVAGVIGTSKFSYDLWGDTVNTASRMESHGEPGKIHVSQAVYEALQQRYTFEERGEIEVKGKGVMRTWFLKEIRSKTLQKQGLPTI